MARHYCTYLDSLYLPRALAMFRSMRQHAQPFTVHVLCLDAAACERLRALNWPEIIPIPLEEFEVGDTALLEAKANRSKVEYYFTCTPSLPLYVFKKNPDCDLITYIDSDLYFYSNPEPLFEELGENSVSIIEHRYAPHLQGRERYGIYNVAWMSFRKNKEGMEVLNWWRERCIEWCYDRLEPTRYGDQKYLDDWTTRFKGVSVLKHKGANVAPWNIGNHKIQLEERGDEQVVMIGDKPLVFFHFQGFKQLKPWLYDPNLATNKARMSSAARKGIFRPYLSELLDVEAALTHQLGAAATARVVKKSKGESSTIFRRVKDEWQAFAKSGKGVVRRQYLFVLNGKVY